MSQAKATKEFVYHMKAMAVHYGSGASHTYALPVHLLHTNAVTGELEAFAANDDAAGVAATNAAIKEAQDGITATVNASSAAASQSVDTLKSSKADNAATNAFVAEMRKQEAAQKAAVNKQITKNFNHLIDVGTKHPKQQKIILSLTQSIGAFFTNILSKVGTFFSNLASSIVSFFKSVGKWFEGAYNSIKTWTSGAVKSVGNFFKGIF